MLRILICILIGTLINLCMYGCADQDSKINQRTGHNGKTYEGKPLAWPTCILTQGNHSVSVEDWNRPPATLGGDTDGDIFKVMIVLNDGNSEDAIPLPLVAPEFRDKVLEECYGNKEEK